VTVDLARSSSIGLVAQYRHLLADDRIDEYSILIPSDHLRALRHEVEASLRPASPEQVAQALAMLVGSFKVGDVLEDRRAFARAMMKQLAPYPVWVFPEMIWRAQRKFEWLPSIAEVIAICDELMNERRRLLRVLDRTNGEYRRRQEEACRIEERQHRDQRWIADLEARAIATHGEAALQAGDLVLAMQLRPAPRCRGRWITWGQALKTRSRVTLASGLAELARAQQGEPSTDLNAAIASIEEATWGHDVTPG